MCLIHLCLSEMPALRRENSAWQRLCQPWMNKMLRLFQGKIRRGPLLIKFGMRVETSKFPLPSILPSQSPWKGLRDFRDSKELQRLCARIPCAASSRRWLWGPVKCLFACEITVCSLLAGVRPQFRQVKWAEG